jgi:hypothetical protein
VSPYTSSEIGTAPEVGSLTGPHWGWGTTRQLWACRISQALGLIAVLALLLALTSVSLP